MFLNDNVMEVEDLKVVGEITAASQVFFVELEQGGEMFQDLRGII